MKKWLYFVVLIFSVTYSSATRDAFFDARAIDGANGVGSNIPGAVNQSENFILSGLSKSEAKSFAQGIGLSEAQLSSVNSAIKRMTSTSVSKITQNGSDVVVQIFRKGHNGYQVIETTVRINGSKEVIQKAYDLSGKLVHFHPK